MFWYNRYLESQNNSFLKKGKVFVLYGPRRVGKTELVKKLISGFEGKIYVGSGDNFELREILSSQRLNKISTFLGNYELIFGLG